MGGGGKTAARFEMSRCRAYSSANKFGKGKSIILAGVECRLLQFRFGRESLVNETAKRGLKRGTRSVREDSRAMGIQCLPAEKLNCSLCQYRSRLSSHSFPPAPYLCFTFLNPPWIRKAFFALPLPSPPPQSIVIVRCYS